MEDNGDGEEEKIGGGGWTNDTGTPTLGLPPVASGPDATAFHWCILRCGSLPDIGLQGGNYSIHGANSNGHGDETRKRERSCDVDNEIPMSGVRHLLWLSLT